MDAATALAGQFDIVEIGYDRTFAGEIVANLQDNDVQLVQFGQGFLSLAAPTAELERLVISRALWHGGHPVLRWNASNVAVRQGPAGNIKPHKERPRGHRRYFGACKRTRTGAAA